MAWTGLAVCLGMRAAQGEPMLYEGGGGWAAVSGLPETAPPPDASWSFEDGAWVGRLPADAQELIWGDVHLPVADALPPPLAPTRLPPMRNEFRPCLVRSLSVRFDSAIRERRWSLVFPREGQEPEFAPLDLPGGRTRNLFLELEDAVSGQRWPLRPERMGREGGMFARQKGEARLYAGTADGGDLDWTLVVAEGVGGRQILQGRVTVLKSPLRLLRARIGVHTGAAGVPVLQTEAPPAVVAVTGGVAVALFADLAEPRRLRAVADIADATGLEFDLAVTKSTGNFPRSATFSVEVDAWSAADAEAALSGSVERLPRAGGSVALPDAVGQAGARSMAVFAPVLTRLSHRGGFQDGIDAVHYLMLKMSGLFRDHDWMASAFLSAAQDAGGVTRIWLEDDSAVVAVNPDPDLETMLEMGQNRGQTVLERIRKSGAPAVWLKAAGTSPGLDYHARALYLCDYPVVWEEGSPLPGVDLRQAEAELIASLACVLKDQEVCLLVSDAGPMAPFTTYHADALVCESADPAEMRRQHALAGTRPVLWLPVAADAASKALAMEFGFVSPPIHKEE
jgi:hypothetical protein